MTWSVFALLTIVAVAVLFLPGMLVTRSAGLRWPAAVAVAPGVSTMTVASAAILADRIGVGWGIIPVVITAILLAAVCFALRSCVDRFEARRTGGGARAGSGLAPHRSGRPGRGPIPRWAWWSASATGAIALMAYHVKVLIGRPDSFSQTFDAIFHLSAVRWIITNANASSLSMTMTAGDSAPSFYPLAWHGVASLVLGLTGSSDVAAGSNATMMAVAAFVWVAGCFYLASVVVRPSASSIVATGFLASAFPSFPYLSITFGVLYPNFMGIALLPATVALTAQLLGLGVGPRVQFRSGLAVLAFSVLGIALAHPNAALLYLAVALPMVWAQGWQPVRRSLREGRRGSALAAIAPSLGATVVVLALWVVLRPPAEASTWEPPLDGPGAIGAAVTLAPMSGKIPWVVALAVLAGIIRVLRTRTNLWLLAGHLVLVFLWIVVSSWDFGPLRSAVTGGWYNDPHRIAAALPVTGLPLAVIGLAWGSRAAVDGLRRTGGALGRLRPWVLEAGLALALVPALLLTTQTAVYLRVVIGHGADTYRLTQDSPLVDTDEYALLQELHELVPEDAVIATVPFNGSSMAYALEGVPTTTTHMLYTGTYDLTIINNSLNRLGELPWVCRALDGMGVTHVLDFGVRPVNTIADWAAQYPGFEDLDDAQGLTQVAREGRAVLYRIDGCAR